MKGSIVVLSAIGLISQLNAQFHDISGFNKQNNALKIEEIARRVKANWDLNQMDVATQVMARVERNAAVALALDRGEFVTADGTPIPGVVAGPRERPIDPRTGTTFGNPLLREESVDGFVEEIMSSLTEEELELIAELEEDTEDGDFPEFDENGNLMFISVPPRGICGTSVDNAEERCGNTCDPELKFCVRTSSNAEENYAQTSMGVHKFYDICYPDVVCVEPDSARVISKIGKACEPLRMNNPCPNSCDCYRSKHKRAMCHQKCLSTENLDIVCCSRMRNQGDKKRKRKIAQHLDLNMQACEYNIYFNHPLQTQDEIESKQLPGLFGTH